MCGRFCYYTRAIGEAENVSFCRVLGSRVESSIPATRSRLCCCVRHRRTTIVRHSLLSPIIVLMRRSDSDGGRNSSVRPVARNSASGPSKTLKAGLQSIAGTSPSSVSLVGAILNGVPACAALRHHFGRSPDLNSQSVGFPRFASTLCSN